MTDDSLPETSPPPKTPYQLLGNKLLRDGLVEQDGRYLHVPTENFHVAQISNYMTVQHLSFDPRNRKQSVEWILAAGSPVLSIEFMDEARTTYCAVDPRFVKANQPIKRHLLPTALAAAGLERFLFHPPLDRGMGVLFIHVTQEGAELIDPAACPDIQEVLQNLDRAYAPEPNA